MRQHIFYKDSISFAGILYQHMGHGADQVAVLDDGGAAHALDDPAGQRQKLGIRHLQFNSPVYIVMIQVHPGDLHIIVPGSAVHSTQDLGRPFHNLLFQADGQRILRGQSQRLVITLAEDSLRSVIINISQDPKRRNG